MIEDISCLDNFLNEISYIEEINDVVVAETKADNPDTFHIKSKSQKLTHLNNVIDFDKDFLEKNYNTYTEFINNEDIEDNNSSFSLTPSFNSEESEGGFKELVCISNIAKLVIIICILLYIFRVE